MKKALLILMAASMLLTAGACADDSGTAPAEDKISAVYNEQTSAEDNESKNINNSKKDDSKSTAAPEASDSETKQDDTQNEENAENPDSKDKKTSKADADTTKPKATKASSGKKDSGVVTVKGQSLRLGMAVSESLINKLGTPSDIQNAPSCHEDGGDDTIYYYNGFTLYTYAKNGVNELYLIEINGSNISTSLGAKVGMSVSDVKSLYGTPTSDSGSTFRYGYCNILFSQRNDTITTIEYCK